MLSLKITGTLALCLAAAAAPAAPQASPRLLTLRTVGQTVTITKADGSRVFSSAFTAPSVRVTVSSRFPRSLTLTEASGKPLWSVAPGAEGLTLMGPWAGKDGGVPRSVTLILGPEDKLLTASVDAAKPHPTLGFQYGTDPTGFYFEKSVPVYGATYKDDDTGGVFDFSRSRFVFQKMPPKGTLDMALNDQHFVFPAGTRFHADTLQGGKLAIVGMAPAGSAFICRL